MGLLIASEWFAGLYSFRVGFNVFKMRVTCVVGKAGKEDAGFRSISALSDIKCLGGGVFIDTVLIVESVCSPAYGRANAEVVSKNA